MTRRDTCHLVGRRAWKLNRSQASAAWHFLARRLEEDLAAMDIPKFRDLISAIRQANIYAKKR